MPTLYPEVIDTTTITEVFSQPQFLVVGVEGVMNNGTDTAGTATVGTAYIIARKSDAETFFGKDSTLSLLIKFLLDRALLYVVAVASKTGAGVTLANRQTAWVALEEDQSVRVRLTDSNLQADLVALADSCEWAEGIQNKQFMVGGLATGQNKAAYSAAAGAINSKRGMVIGPGVYDHNGNLLGGPYSAAWVTAEVAKNPDISDDLDTFLLPGSTGIEKAASGVPLFRIKAGAGSPVNDFEDLLQTGVSPLRQGRRGGAEITHLRMTYTADETYDALQTRLVVDQVFIDVRDFCEESLALRKPNTAVYRADLASQVNRLLAERANWISPRLQPDGKIGYGVAVTPTVDGHGIRIHYIGTIIRNTQTIEINGSLQIAA